MANRFKGLLSNETVENISHVRTPMTPDNKYKRIGLLIMGVALIIAGVAVWIITSSV